MQVLLIVLGHVIAVYLAHLRAGERFRTARRALLSQFPMLVLMVLYTMTGQAIERCAGFDGDAIAASAVMSATGTQFQMVGITMCQIDHEPQQVADCTTEQAHWTLWLYSTGAWSMPAAGCGQLQPHDHEALGWRYVASAEPSPSPPIAPQPL